MSRRRQLHDLKMCARDRSGHAILVLSSFLVPDIPLAHRTPIFAAGSMIAVSSSAAFSTRSTPARSPAEENASTLAISTPGSRLTAWNILTRPLGSPIAWARPSVPLGTHAPAWP